MKSIKVLKNLESYMLGEWKAAGRGGVVSLRTAVQVIW